MSIISQSTWGKNVHVKGTACAKAPDNAFSVSDK